MGARTLILHWRKHGPHRRVPRPLGSVSSSPGTALAAAHGRATNMPNSERPQQPEPTPQVGPSHATGLTPIGAYLKHAKRISFSVLTMLTNHFEGIANRDPESARERFEFWLLNISPRMAKVLRVDSVIVARVRESYAAYLSSFPVDAAIKRVSSAQCVCFKALTYVLAYKITGPGAARHLMDRSDELVAAIEDLRQYEHFTPTPVAGVAVPDERDLLQTEIAIPWDPPLDENVLSCNRLAQVEEQTHEFGEFMNTLPDEEQRLILEGLVNPEFEPPVPSELTMTERCCLRALSQLQNAGNQSPTSDQIADRGLGTRKRGAAARPLAHLAELGLVESKKGRGGGYLITPKGATYLK
jgi:hypothetical protein